jgi:hypothetical protein
MKIAMKFTALISSVVLVLFLSACSNKPGDAEIEKQIKASLMEGGGELYEVVSVQKVNGREVSEKEYLAEAECELRFKVGLRDLRQQAHQSSRDWVAQIEAMAEIELLEEMFGPFNAGDVKKVKDVFAFAKTEKGWMLQKLEL